MAKLTDKQKKFVAEYLVDLNATQAAIRAEYSEKTARQQGQRLLTNVDIQAAIQERQKELSEKTNITQEKVLTELAAIAFANGTDFASVNANGLIAIKATSQVPKEKLPAIAGIKYTNHGMGVEIKLHDKVRALELLGKHLGVFDRQQGGTDPQENNIFDVINRSTREELDTSAIP